MVSDAYRSNTVGLIPADRYPARMLTRSVSIYQLLGHSVCSVLLAVNGVKAAKAGAEITYTVIVISGNSSVPATSKLFIPVTATGLSIPEAITNCKTGANTTNIPLQATLAAQTALVCHFKYIVTPDMVADGQLPSLSIVPQTMVASYAYDYVAAAQIIQVGPGFPSYPAAALPVPVYTAPALTASSAVDPAATTTYTTGKLLSNCTSEPKCLPFSADVVLSAILVVHDVEFVHAETCHSQILHTMMMFPTCS